MHLIYLDTETTGLDPNARLVQLAYKTSATGEALNEYFKPPIPISFGAMSMHHITEKKIADKPVFKDSAAQARLIALLAEGHIPVAHNAAFDIHILKNEDVTIGQHIDTLRLAKHLVTSEQYKLQYLRYFLDLDAEGLPHDAAGDVMVLEALFNRLRSLTQEKFTLAGDDEVMAKMLELSQTPVLLKTFGFGKHINKTFEEVSFSDRGYLEWLYGSESKKNKSDQDEDLVHTLKHYLN